jgi:cyclopropane fatty-acyl-phospholipid synthase-like methyltransferase
MPEAGFSYDVVAYPGRAYAQTHPDRLATIASLFGLQAAPVGQCRVLEIGCGDGGNLIPMACHLPESRFTGIDLSARAIAQGCALIERLGLDNVRLIHMDLMDWDPAGAQFDYVVAHGVYSWVPVGVQDKLLAICGAHLAPKGVAFVSYNAMPGSHLRTLVREMLLFHAEHFDEAETKIAQAQAFLRFLIGNTSSSGDEYSALLRKEMERISRHTGAYLFHDDLAEHHNPAYFHQFARHAARHGMQYLGEADFHEMQTDPFPPEAREHLRGMAANGLYIQKEQIQDFLRCRRFRQTLLCRAEVPLQREPGPDRIQNYYIASAAAPKSGQPEWDPESAEEFQTPGGASVSVKLPLVKAVLRLLFESWPQAIHFSELLARAHSLVSRQSGTVQNLSVEDAARLSAALWTMYSSGVIELHTCCSRFTLKPSDYPVADPLCRAQAELGPYITNMRHMTVEMDDAAGRGLLPLMDGSRSRDTLEREYARLLAAAGEQREWGEGGLKADFEQTVRRLAELAVLSQ